jgi:hypothetical protein
MAEQVCADLDRMASEINKLLEFAELALDAKSLKHAFRGLQSVAEAKALALLAYDKITERHSAANAERYKEMFKRAETLIRAYQSTFTLAFLIAESSHSVAPVARVIRHVEKHQRTGKKLNEGQKTALIRVLRSGKPSGVTDNAWYKLLGTEYGISHFTVKYYADTYANGR